MDSSGVVPWRVVWGSDTDDDPRLIRRWYVGSVDAVAWWQDERRPLLAFATTQPSGSAAGQTSYGLGVRDVETGRSVELPCGEPVTCLAFAPVVEGPVLVSGHGDGLRVYNAADGSLTAAIPDAGHVVDVAVLRVGGGLQAVTLGSLRRVQRWWLPSGEPVDGPEPPPSRAIAVTRLLDGRPVLLAGEDSLTLWDLQRAEPVVVPPPNGLQAIRRVVPWAAQGRDRATVVHADLEIVTVDLATGVPVAEPITAHRSHPRIDGLMVAWTRVSGPSEIAVVGGSLAVSTRWRVHLWDPSTCRPAGPPLAGPVAAARLTSVGWRGRDLLLTSSGDDGVVGLWDPRLPVRRVAGHEQRISGSPGRSPPTSW